MTLLNQIKTEPMRPMQFRIIAICLLLAMIDGYEVVAMPFSIPAIAKTWSLASAEVGYLLSAGIFGMALGAVFVSPLADRIGRRKHILMCLGLITVAMFLSGLAQSLWALVAIRAVAGLFIGAMISSLNIMVSEYASEKRRGLVMGLYGAGLPLGSALAGYAIAPLIAHFGWHAPFFFGAFLTAAMTVLVWAILPESIDYLLHSRHEGALASYNRIARSIGQPEVDELPPLPASEKTHSTSIGALFEGSLLLRTALLWLGYATLISAFYFANTWTAKIIADTTGDANLGIKVAMLIQFGGVLGAVIYGILTLCLHPRVATILLLALGGVAFYAYAQSVGNISTAMVLAFLIGISANGGVAAYYAISPSIYPTILRGTGVGLMIGFGRGVAILAPLFTGFMLAGYWTPVDAYKFFAVVMIVSALAAIGLHLTYGKGAKPVEVAQ